MLRLLPYLLILLVVLFFSKLLNIIEDYMNILNIQESSAQLNKSLANTQNQTPALAKNDEINDKTSTLSDKGEKKLKQTNPKSLLQKDFQLESEKKLLQQLRKRRKEIESYKEEVSTTKETLDSVKQYIDDRLKLLENIQHKVKPYLYDHNQQDDQKIKKLVKIYESMQPKDAAKIFNDLQLEILIEVAINMKESHLAPILAKMQTEKARELTAKLATRKNAHIFNN